MRLVTKLFIVFLALMVIGCGFKNRNKVFVTQDSLDSIAELFREENITHNINQNASGEVVILESTLKDVLAKGYEKCRMCASVDDNNTDKKVYIVPGKNIYHYSRDCQVLKDSYKTDPVINNSKDTDSSGDRVYVQGHYRKTKSGKTVWVKPYTRSKPKRK